MAVGSFFFSAAPTAQNSQELHFCFINSSIQPSVVKSVLTPKTWFKMQSIWIQVSTYIGVENKTFIFPICFLVLEAKFCVSASAGWGAENCEK